jgi:hypothetical protein
MKPRRKVEAKSGLRGQLGVLRVAGGVAAIANELPDSRWERL